MVIPPISTSILCKVGNQTQRTPDIGRHQGLLKGRRFHSAIDVDQPDVLPLFRKIYIPRPSNSLLLQMTWIME